MFDFLEEVEGGVEDHEEAVGGKRLAAFGAGAQQLDEPAHVQLDGFRAERHLFAVFEVGFSKVENLCQGQGSVGDLSEVEDRQGPEALDTEAQEIVQHLQR